MGQAKQHSKNRTAQRQELHHWFHRQHISSILRKHQNREEGLEDLILTFDLATSFLAPWEQLFLMGCLGKQLGEGWGV